MAAAGRRASAHLAAVPSACRRCAGTFLILLAATRGRGLKPRRENWAAVALRGALGVSSLTLYYVAVAWAGAGLGTLIHCMYPVWTALYVGWRNAHRISTKVFVALVL